MVSTLKVRQNLKPSLIKEGRYQAGALGEVGGDFSPVKNISEERTQLLEVGVHEHISDGGELGDIGANTGRRDSITENFGVGGVDVCLGRRQRDVISAKVTEKDADIDGTGCQDRRRKY